MKDIEWIKNELLKEDIKKAVLSSPFEKTSLRPFKITAEPIMLKDGKYFRFSFFIDKKVIHENVAADVAVDRLLEEMSDTFKQCFVAADCDISILLNSKGKFHLKRSAPTIRRLKVGAHNREKNYILKDGEPIDWAIMAGIMSESGKVYANMQKKFRQVNKFLEMLSTVEDRIPQNALITDMGCGKSYLTFALYHYFNVVKGKNVCVKGFDLKKDVVEKCNNAAKVLNYENISFQAGDIADISSDEKINMLVTLHACDTATDIALYHAVRLGCDVIMSVPCCQHELFSKIQNDLLRPLLGYGILKERFAALLTDTIRAYSLELCGYRVNVEEFIETDHTPKNIMIKAVRTGRGFNNAKYDELKRIVEEFSADVTAYRLLSKFFMRMGEDL